MLKAWLLNCNNNRLKKAIGGPGITGKTQPIKPSISNKHPISIST